MPIAATRSSADVRAKPLFQNTAMARRRATSLSNSLGRAIASTMAVIERVVKNTAITTKALRAERGAAHSLRARHVDVTELRQLFGREGLRRGRRPYARRCDDDVKTSVRRTICASSASTPGAPKHHEDIPAARHQGHAAVPPRWPLPDTRGLGGVHLVLGTNLTGDEKKDLVADLRGL